MMNNDRPENAADLVSVVADNIKGLRGQRGFSLSELASRAGIGKSTLSLLEAGRGNPSIETLWAIAAALGVTMAQMIESSAPPVRVLRAGEGIRVEAEGSKLGVFLLASSNRRSSFELYTLHAEPGSPLFAEPHLDGTVEHLLVQSGRMVAGPKGATVDLRAGDLASFGGDLRHSYEALEPGTRAVLLMEYT